MTCKHISNTLHAPLQDSHSSHSHDHDHDHDHSHEHDFRSVDKKVLKISLIITLVTMIAEIAYGYITGSLALLSDGIHMLTHTFSLALSLFAILIAQKALNASKTFGYFRSEVIVAFVNSLTLGVSVVFIVYEAIERIFVPQAIDIGTMMVVAIIGLIVNAITGFLLFKGDMENINIKSSFAHMMSDLLSSVAIVVGGVIIYYTDFYFIDALLAVMIAIVIGKWSWGLFKDSLNVLLESSPVDTDLIKNEVVESGLVVDIHDIHVTEITHKMYVLTAHIVVDKANLANFKEIVDGVSEILEHKFGIGHVTLQPEWH